MVFYAAVGMTNSILRCAKGKKLGQEMDTCNSKNPEFRGMVVFSHPFYALMLLWAELMIIFKHQMLESSNSPLCVLFSSVMFPLGVTGVEVVEKSQI